MQQIGVTGDGIPIYGEKHRNLSGEFLHNPKPATIENFTVQPGETVITPTYPIGNYAMVRLWWNGALQFYPMDYTLSSFQVTLLFIREFPAQITLEYYP